MKTRQPFSDDGPAGCASTSIAGRILGDRLASPEAKGVRMLSKESSGYEERQECSGVGQCVEVLGRRGHGT